MRVISVITVRNNAVEDIESWGVFEEQFSQDITKHAEKYFLEKCKEYGLDSNIIDVEELKYNNYYEFNDGSISIVGAYI